MTNDGLPPDGAPEAASGSLLGRLTRNSLENDPHRWRQRLLGGGVALSLLGLLLAGLLIDGREERGVRHAGTSETNLTLHPGQAQREAYALKTETRLEELSERLERTERNLRELSERQLTSIRSLAGEVKEHRETIESIDRDRRILMESRKGGDAAARSTPGEGPRWTPERLERAAGEAGGIGGVQGVPALQAPGDGAPRLAIVTMTPPEDARSKRRPAAAPAPLVRAETPIDLNRAPGSTVGTYLPAGSFVRATLLTGVYAPTGGAASAAGAMPVLLRLDRPAVLPNRWRSKVERCHVTGTATGDISSERTLIRLDRLSCVSTRGGTLDIRVSGYAVGSDGRVGIRSRLVTRSGQAIAAALSTSLLSGIGRAVSLSTQSTTTNALTGSDTVRYDNALKAGLGTGLSSGMDRLVSYYLDMARHIFPVLEVDSGVHADLVFSQGTVLTDDL